MKYMKKTFKLKLAINHLGYVGEISMDAELISDNKLSISFNQFVDKSWHNAIEFGINYFYEHSKVEFRKGLAVNVEELASLAIDTSSIVVVYLAVKCLCEIFEYPHELINLNPNGMFILSK